MGSSESTAQESNDAQRVESTTREWQWPSWSLDHSSPKIEVFVLDPCHVEGGAWTRAKPKWRVVDHEGRDAFLCAQYTWNGDDYDEEFGPDRVRRGGEEITVCELACLGVEETEGLAYQHPSEWHKNTRNVQLDQDGYQLCDVCMDRPCDSILHPCLHGGICEPCAKKIASNGAAGGSRCPQCRQVIEDVVKIGVRPNRKELKSAPDSTRHQSKTASVLDEATKTWNWPDWCQSKAGLLEVLVVDNMSTRRGWVEATPKMRFVAEDGEKYLCAEYMWDDELYIEDFSTDRIRRKHDFLTLQQQLILERAHL